MQLSIGYIRKLTVTAGGDDVGKVNDILIDERQWAVRYLVVDTGSWLVNRNALVSPLQLQIDGWDLTSRMIEAKLTRSQIEESPQLESDAPISRQFEEEYAKHYGHTAYWLGQAYGAPHDSASIRPSSQDQIDHQERVARIEADYHVRSCNELLLYEIHDVDGESLGRVKDLTVALPEWQLAHLMIGLGWLLGKEDAFIDAASIQAIHWKNRTISLAVRKSALVSPDT